MTAGHDKEFVPVTGWRRFREGWAQTWKLGRHWRIEVEWIPAARSYDFWIYDERRSDRG